MTTAERIQEYRDHQGQTYGYRMKSLNDGSDRYGVCECCGKPVSTTSYQVEVRLYNYNGQPGWTHHLCRSLFGHDHCLIAARRGAVIASLTPHAHRR
jgi:hypothetical protein